MDFNDQLNLAFLAQQAGILLPHQGAGLTLNYEKVCTCGAGPMGWGIHRASCPVHTFHVSLNDRHTLLKELLEIHAPDLLKPEPRHQLDFHITYWSADADELLAMEKLLKMIEAGEHDRQTLGLLAKLVISNPDARLEISSVDINWGEE